LKPTPREIVDELLKGYPLDKCVPINEAIGLAIKKIRTDLADSAVSELAEERRWRVISLVNHHIREYETKSVPPKVTWSESDRDRLIGRCFSPLGTAPSESQKRGRLGLIEPLAAILHELHWSEFEVLSARVVEMLGGSDVRVTGQPYDDGIDFAGNYRSEGRLLEGENRPIMGQSKRLSAPIGPENMTRFTDAYQAACAVNPKTIGFFFTTSRFTLGAVELAELRHVMARDGHWIAYKLLMNEIGFSVEGGLHADLESLRSWLH
jgi:Restriction endonuclease